MGIDVVDVPRFSRTLARTPRLRARLFTEGERDRSDRSLAARFAAKEAFIKCLGDSAGATWQEIEVVNDSEGDPTLRLHGRASEAARERGMTALHVSMSHDGHLACAVVVAETLP